MKTDFLVIGSGIAGLSFALKVASLGKVVVVTKKKKVDTATNLAQGGIAAVLAGDDSFEKHVADTLEAGAGLCDEEIVRFVVTNGPERVAELIALGVNFVKEKDGHLSLAKEGGHSMRRIAHAYDLTGKEIERALVASVTQNDNITLLENHMAVDLITSGVGEARRCVGAYVLDDQGDVSIYRSKTTTLCTGGAGKVYLYSSNPDIATGDGVALAHRIGAETSGMEFVQFHPTCLYHHQAKNFLISEAVRGEGALLFDGEGRRFLEDYEPEKMELATRDKVARAIDSEMKKTGADCVYLDIRHKGREFLEKRFPTIFGKCLSLGIDISKEPIPVVPAAHYLCGGVKTDIHGRTTIEGLFCLGESACTGLHGGNRLASNSLLEAVVFAHSAYEYCKENRADFSEKSEDSIVEYHGVNNQYIDEEILINHNWDIIRRIMWNYVGIVRNQSRLALAKQRIIEIKDEVESMVADYKISPNMLELRNILDVALLVIEASQKRKKSQGLHFILDD
ncbi:MAG: L-aspartate oxidase [Desulfotalea sp.]|nr:MAG: L-aspartate oxidase [Desulfotalea sp.]